MGELFAARFATDPILACLRSGGASGQSWTSATPPAGPVSNAMSWIIGAAGHKADGGRPDARPCGSTARMHMALLGSDAPVEICLNEVNDMGPVVGGGVSNPSPVGRFVRTGSGMRRVADPKGRRVPSQGAAFQLNRPQPRAVREAGAISRDEVAAMPIPAPVRPGAPVSGPTDAAFLAVGGPNGPKGGKVGASLRRARHLELASAAASSLQADATAAAGRHGGGSCRPPLCLATTRPVGNPG